MWEERVEMGRKYTIHQQENGGAPMTGYGNRGYDHTEDLHAWSIYRQNLNADLSESAIGSNKAPNAERPFGNFQLKESTVNNILNHPKYGPQSKNHDPYTYLRFGLPRVKASQSEIGVARLGQDGNHPRAISANGLGPNGHRGHLKGFPHGMTSDSASGSDEEYEGEGERVRGQARRNWKSDPDLARTQTDNALRSDGGWISGVGPGRLAKGGGVDNGFGGHGGQNGKAVSEIDLRHISNGQGKLQLEDGLPSVHSKHPHLIVRNMTFEMDKTSDVRLCCGAQRKKLRILDSITFEVRAGEILALMATNEMEGTAILDVLGDQYNHCKCRVKVDLILNGVYMNPSKMSSVVAYAKKEVFLCPQMSARQTLLFSTLLQRPAKKNAFDTKKRTDAVLEELGLSEVRHTSVGDLTEAERRRLIIAMNLLMDTEILLLDQPTLGMDIFDSFFLIEYLRQWALISGRLVILTIQPATYEIFTMLSKIALISTGRIMYFGKRKDLLSYFAYIDFPCPAFKNPSDYYLDLVTLDNLSAEAMAESSQRIDNLAEAFGRRFSGVLPGPPAITPPPVNQTSFPIHFLALWIRALIFTFPYNVINLFRHIFIALCSSIALGVIFWHVRVKREQEHLWDRVAFHHIILTLLPLPIFLLEMQEMHKEKEYVVSESKMGLYSRPAFVLSKLLYSFPRATLVHLALALPASSMAGLQQDLLPYIIIILVFYHTLRLASIAAIWAFDRRSNALTAFGLLFLFLTLGAGTSFHYKDLSIGARWIRSISPARWAHEGLLAWEFGQNASVTFGQGSQSRAAPFECSHAPVIQKATVLTKANCGIQSRANLLAWFNYDGGNSEVPIRSLEEILIPILIAFGVFLVISSIGFCFLASRRGKKGEGNLLIKNSDFQK